MKNRLLYEQARKEIEDQRQWCAQHRLVSVVSNDDHHWRIYRESENGRAGEIVAQWWPSSSLAFVGTVKIEDVRDVNDLRRQLVRHGVVS